MKNIKDVADFLKSEFKEKIDIAIVLGSGLSNLTEELEILKEIEFDKIPHFTKSNIVGHQSKVVFAKYKGKNIVALKGRFHFYEGYEMEKILLPVRAFALMGIKNLIVTNACGGISDFLNPGDIMLIKDHLSLFAPSPLKGKNLDELGTRFPDMSECYNANIRQKAKEIAKQLNIELKEGVYGFFQGPMYETPAEINAYKILGANSVGMSTVPEVIAAVHAGMKVMGISLITNKAAGLGDKLDHKEVLDIAKVSEEKLKKLVKDETPIVVSDKKVNDIKKEMELVSLSLQKAKSDLIKLQEIAKEKLGEEKAAIFEAHAQILEDPALTEEWNALISEGFNGAYSIKTIADKYFEMFSAMDDEYFKERSADIKDVTDRLIRYVMGLPVTDLASISEEVIILAEDLTPSQTAQLNPKFVKGFACNIGGRTSHAAIMARSLEIPAVLALKSITHDAKNGEIIAMDAESFAKEKKELESFKDKKTITKDGFDKFILEGNIGSPKDVVSVLEHGGEGIGLFRSEFLYMDNDHFPTEEEQFVAYKKVVEDMKGKIVVIRTLDIGGDKKLSYFKFPEEMNPFLGYRAIRFTMDRKDIFKDQIRALLRASAFGPLAKEFVLEQKAILTKEGHKVGKDLEIGMMVEIPAAAVNAANFAKHADFFSIGTNDLIQYTMAADRMSENVTYLYQPYNPSILNLIKLTIDGAHSKVAINHYKDEVYAEAVAKATLSYNTLQFIPSLIATGTIVVAGNLIGQGRKEEVSKVVVTGLLVNFAITGVIFISIEAAANQIVYLMDATEGKQIIHNGQILESNELKFVADYYRYMNINLIMMSFSQVFIAGLQSMKKSSVVTIGAVISNLIDVVIVVVILYALNIDPM
ncbi:hypothetical protein FQR65_LT16671 [Abscondita terminalis]|nr:hypothetical protein FQR65_LT16671 [Abscondita terminalis]